MSAATESELGFPYINNKEATPTHHALKEMVQKQPPTPMQTYIKMALVIVKNNVMENLKPINMEFHWLWCRENEQTF